jgi:hypothetical protein
LIPGYASLFATALQRKLEAAAIQTPENPTQLLPVVACRVLTETVRCLLDTGATHWFLDSKLAERFGMTMRSPVSRRLRTVSFKTLHATTGSSGVWSSGVRIAAASSSRCRTVARREAYPGINKSSVSEGFDEGRRRWSVGWNNFAVMRSFFGECGIDGTDLATGIGFTGSTLKDVKLGARCRSPYVLGFTQPLGGIHSQHTVLYFQEHNFE